MLDMRGANLQWANLNKTDLRKANLSTANLYLADLDEADLNEALLYETQLTEENLHAAYLSGAYLRGKKVTRDDLQWTHIRRNRDLGRKTVEAERNIATVRIQINEEPLTALNLATIISSLTELYTKCWLIQQDRFGDLAEYIQTYDPRFIEEANLVINKLTKQSPALIDLLIGPASIASAGTLALALKIAIDSIIQTPLRFKEKQEANKEKELANRDKEIELEKKYIEYKLDEAKKIVETVHPGIDDASKSELMQTVLLQLLKLDKSKGVTLVLPSPQDKKSNMTDNHS
jgi:hypothetical protein